MLPLSIKIIAPIVPVPFKRVMQSGRRRFNDARYTEYKEVLGFFASKEMKGRPFLTGALKIHAEFYKRVPKEITSARWGDGDNFLKAVLDALQGICYENDAQIVQGSFTKKIGEPKVIVTLEAIL